MGYLTQLPIHVRVAEVLHVGHRYATAIRNREHPPVTTQSTDRPAESSIAPSKRDLAVDEIVGSRSPKGGGRETSIAKPQEMHALEFFFSSFLFPFFPSSSEVSKDQGSLVLQKTNGIGIHDALGAVYDRSSRTNTIRWQLRSASCCCCYYNPTTTAPHRNPSDT